jgi:rhamnosyltransferase subunit B
VSRILLTTFGSYGDLHPYLAMTRAFRGAGHDVVLATHPDYRDFVEQAGAQFVPMRPSLADAGPEEVWTKKANHPRSGIEYICRGLILPFLESNYETLNVAAQGCDLALSHLLTFATPIVAEKRGIPWLSVVLQPSVFLSVADPPAAPVLPSLPRMPKWFVRGFFWLGLRISNSWLQPVHQLRSRLGLPLAANPLLDGFSPHGTLALFPETFAAPQPDWPRPLRQVGFPLFDTESSPHLSPELEAFLDAGDPPVVFTLGSSIVRMRHPFYETAHEVARRLGRRAVLLAGVRRDAVRQAVGNDSAIFVAGYEPHSLILPRAAAIVHHCGIGTTAQALVSGKPQVAVAFAHDQPDNARRIERLGVGVALPAGKVSVSTLTRALETTLSGDRAARAAAFAKGLSRDSFGPSLLAAVEALAPARIA